VIVGPSVNRYGGDLDFQTFAVGTRQRIPRRARLQMDGQEQVVTLPLIPWRRHRISGEQRQDQHSQYLQADNRKQWRQVDAGNGGYKMPDRSQQWVGKTVKQ